MRETKTLEEIFTDKYGKVEEMNEIKATEAIGWLRGVSFLAPSWEYDAQIIIEKISTYQIKQLLREAKVISDILEMIK